MDNKELEKDFLEETENPVEIDTNADDALAEDIADDVKETEENVEGPFLFNCDDDVLNSAYDAAAPIVDENKDLSHAPTSVYDGPLSHMGEEDTKPGKFPIVTPVIIAAVAFLLTAALVFGALGIYDMFIDKGIVDTWVVQGSDSGAYFVFESDGTVRLDQGSIALYGTYDTATYDMSSSTDDLPAVITTINQYTPLSGKVNVLKTNFNEFGMYGGEFVYSIETVDGVKTLNLKMVYSEQVADIVFEKATMPSYKLNPSEITNASADEAGVKTLYVNEKAVGQWHDADNGATYTFNANGTGTYITDCIENPQYLLYGMSVSYGLDYEFKYTMDDGYIYMSFETFASGTLDDTVFYSFDGDKIIINNVGYTKK